MTGKRNKKRKTYDDSTPRNERQVCFNTPSDSSQHGYLSPKESLISLQNKLQDVRILQAQHDSIDLRRKAFALRKDIETCHKFLSKESERARRKRAASSALERVVKTLPAMTEDELRALVDKIENVLASKMANREVDQAEVGAPVVLVPPIANDGHGSGSGSDDDSGSDSIGSGSGSVVSGDAADAAGASGGTSGVLVPPIANDGHGDGSGSGSDDDSGSDSIGSGSGSVVSGDAAGASGGTSGGASDDVVSVPLVGGLWKRLGSFWK